MARQIFDPVEKKWFTPEEYAAVKAERDGVKNQAHFIQTDEIAPVVSHAVENSPVFTSRSALNRHYKEHGFECTGGDHLTGKDVSSHRVKVDKEALRADVLEAARKIKWGMAPMTEQEKETCLREKRAFEEYKKRNR